MQDRTPTPANNDAPANADRRFFIIGGLASLAALGSAAGILGAFSIKPKNAPPIKADSVRLEAKSWSELPEILQQYEAMIDKEPGGISRVFGYASIVNNPGGVKPKGSRNIPDEDASLPGMEVAMNVLAAGEYEFRGARGSYVGPDGTPRPFANIGIYAGLEPSSDKNSKAMGKAMTASRSDRLGSLKDYIERELGKPPAGLTLDDLFDPKKSATFAALKNTPEDAFGMYKFQVVDLDLRSGRKVPAVTVSTNESSKFAAIGLTPMQTAQLILDGQGYVREGGKKGGSALDYFKQSVMAVARKNNLRQPRLEAIDSAVEELAHVYAEVSRVIEGPKSDAEKNAAIEKILREHPSMTGDDRPAIFRGDTIKGLFSPYYYDGENVNKRAPVSEEERKLPENQMSHTAAEKLRRVAALAAAGKTERTP